MASVATADRHVVLKMGRRKYISDDIRYEASWRERRPRVDRYRGTTSPPAAFLPSFGSSVFEYFHIISSSDTQRRRTLTILEVTTIDYRCEDQKKKIGELRVDICAICKVLTPSSRKPQSTHPEN